MTTRIMYIEPKGMGDRQEDHNPGRMARVSFSKSGKSLRYGHKTFQRVRGECGNYQEEATGEFYWISGPKKDGNDRLSPGLIEIDDDVREEYWCEIRKMPDQKNTSSFKCSGKHGGKRPSRLNY